MNVRRKMIKVGTILTSDMFGRFDGTIRTAVIIEHAHDMVRLAYLDPDPATPGDNIWSCDVLIECIETDNIRIVS